MSYTAQMMQGYKHGAKEESSINDPEGALKFEEQMKKAMKPHWKHFEEAREKSMIAAQTRMLR